MPPFRVRAVVFDLDGTLLDSHPGIAASVNAARESLGLAALPVGEVELLVGWGVERLIAGAFPEPLRERAREAYVTHYGATCTKTTASFPGALAALEELHGRGFRLGVATNKPASFTEELLVAVHLRPLLGAVAGADGRTPLKPAPDLLLAVLGSLGVPPRDAVYVGDRVVDVETGAAAGVRVIGVTTGGDPADVLRDAGAGAVVKGLGELRRLVEIDSRAATGSGSKTS